MPLYRTKPDISLDDLIQHLEWVGETVVTCTPVDGEWVVLTHPLPARRRPSTTINSLETR